MLPPRRGDLSSPVPRLTQDARATLDEFYGAVSEHRRNPSAETLHETHHRAWAHLTTLAILIVAGDPARTRRSRVVFMTAGNARCPN